MGNQANSVAKPPFTNKRKVEYQSNEFNIGLSEMQGWRNSMEDASLIHVAKIHKSDHYKSILIEEGSSYENDLKETIDKKSFSSSGSSEVEVNKNNLAYEYLDKISLFGIFDGHGGSYVSQFTAENFYEVFKHAYSHKYNDDSDEKSVKYDKKLIRKISNCSSYIEKVEQALIQTFLDIDELLLTSIFKEMVKDMRKGKRNNLKIDNFNDIVNDNMNYLDSEQDSPGYMMGTTANVISIYNNYLIIANAGDSLSVLFSNGKAIILNSEHKVSIKGEEDRILKSGFKIYNGRVDGKLNLTRAIGDLQFKDRKLRPYEQAVTAYPEVLSYELTEDAEFLISGCDGIWDCVEPQKFCEFISMELKKNIKISQIVANVEDMILSKTISSPIGTDNMTCFIIKFNKNNQ